MNQTVDFFDKFSSFIRRWNAKVRILSPINEPTEDLTSAVADREQLEHSFRELSPEQRAVVVLHHHYGYPLTEIASVLGIPEGTARSRLHYGVRRIRAALDPVDRRVLASEERSA